MGAGERNRVTELDGVNDWNKQIIAEFRANEGKVGGPFEGATMLLLHHVGARSGTERVTPLVYFPGGDRMVIVASAAGAPKNPDWYHNIKASPRVEVEVGTDTVAVEAQELAGVERDEKWAEITAAAPGFAEYQTKTSRVIPVIALKRVA
jgi:deazaflavin-dependent oxidoreductase (nitroreductase family)